jgi:hypothetical protein
MKKLFSCIANILLVVENVILYFIIRYRTGCPKKSEELYNAIYGYKESLVKNNNKLGYSPVVITKDKIVNNKKQEIINSINYLRNKSVKTKQDKESIYTLEMVLKNMK